MSGLLTREEKMTDFAAKLEALEQEKLVLIAKRKEEIATIIDKTNCIGIENDILIGALLFIKEATENSTHTDLLQQFREKAKHSFRKRAAKPKPASKGTKIPTQENPL